MPWFDWIRADLPDNQAVLADLPFDVRPGWFGHLGYEARISPSRFARQTALLNQPEWVGAMWLAMGGEIKHNAPNKSVSIQRQ